MTPEVQSVLGRYRLGEAIGSGGMGTVVRATDEILGREVAVKLLREELVDDERSLMRFRREAQIAASLSHPGIAAVYDFAEDDGRPAIVMELLDGHDLHTLLARDGPMDPAQVTTILAQAADALAYAHSLGAVHRDVKPANIFLTRSGAVKVTDFGVAYAAGGGQLTTTGALIGTPDYLSPEQVRGERATAASDIYSLGCVAYQLLTGQPPFTGDNAIAVATARLDAPPPSTRALLEAVPDALDVVIRRAMASAPGDRFPSAAAMAKALRAVTPSSLEALTPPPRGGGGPQTLPMGPTGGVTGPPTMIEPPPIPPGPETPPAPLPLPDRPGRRGRWTWVWVAVIVIVLAGMTVDVVRSLQRLNAPKVIPTWTGLSFDQARAAAQKLGFSVARSDTDGVAPQGTVLQTAPPGGAKLKRGGTVTLTVSRGNQANVPDVKTMNVDDATNLLKGQGFKVQVADQTVPGPVDGQVAAQDPPSGTAAPKGSTVTLTQTAASQSDKGDNSDNGNATPNPLSSLFNSLFGGASPSPTPAPHHHGGNG